MHQHLMSNNIVHQLCHHMSSPSFSSHNINLSLSQITNVILSLGIKITDLNLSISSQSLILYPSISSNISSLNPNTNSQPINNPANSSNSMINHNMYLNSLKERPKDITKQFRTQRGILLNVLRKSNAPISMMLLKTYD
jgi:hypothetical protein